MFDQRDANPWTHRCGACGFVSPSQWPWCARCGRLTSNSGRASEPFAVGGEVVSTPLIGQSEASEALHKAIDHSFSMGSPSIVTLLGPYGSGKSRLLIHASEFAARLSEQARVLYAETRPSDGDRPYTPFSDLLSGFFSLRPELPDPVARGKVHNLVKQVLATHDAVTIAETSHLLGHVAGIEFPDSPFIRDIAPMELRRRAAEAVSRFLQAESNQEHTLLLIDNAHHMQETAWQILQGVVDEASHLVVVLASERPLTERLQSFASHVHRTTTSVAKLSESDIQTMLFVLMPNLEAAPEPFVSALAHRSKGSPRLLRELVLLLREAGGIVEEDEMLRVDLARLEDGSLPVSIDDAIAARIDRLDALEFDTLGRASVVGDRFWDGAVLAQLRAEQAPPGSDDDPLTIWTDDDDSESVGEVLDRLVSKGFIRPVRASELPATRAFVFELGHMREAIYGRMSNEVRLLRHWTVARWLASMANTRREGVAALIAPHLEAAGSTQRAGRAYFEAAVYERARSRTFAALAYVEKALSLIPSDDVIRRIDALHEWGSLLVLTGRNEEAISAFTRMLRAAWSIGAKGKGAAALNRIGRVYKSQGQSQKASHALRRALELFRAGGDLRGVAATLDDLAQILRIAGKEDEAFELAEEALAIRRDNDDQRGEAVSLATLGGIELTRGQLDRAEEFFTRALAIRQSIGDETGTTQSYNQLGVVAFERGDIDTATTSWNEALARANKVGDRHLQCVLFNNLGEAHLYTGALEQAEHMLNQARSLAERLGDRPVLADILRNQGLLALRAKRDTAEELFDQALAVAEQTGGALEMARVHRAIGLGCSKRQPGDDQRAEQSFRRSVELFQQLDNQREVAKALSELGFFLLQRDRQPEALQWLEEAASIMRDLGMPEEARVGAAVRSLRPSAAS